MTDPRVEALARELYDSSGMFFPWPSLAPEAHDMFRENAARILADLDRLAWRDVAKDPPPDSPPHCILAFVPMDGDDWWIGPVWWDEEGWMTDGITEQDDDPNNPCGEKSHCVPVAPTHWQPLPPPPGKEGEG